MADGSAGIPGVDESTDHWRQELRHDIRDAILADLRGTRLERFAR